MDYWYFNMNIFRPLTLYFSVLLSSLYHLVNEAATRQYLSSDLTMTLTQILDVYVSQWQLQEEELKAKERDESSLYRYKSEVHGDERSEEEQLEAEFRQSFPVFTQVKTMHIHENKFKLLSFITTNTKL